MSFAQRLRRIAGLFVKQRFCPLCGWRGFRFEPFGNSALYRCDALCPSCGSLERHRAVHLLLKDRIGSGHKVLHAAPEQIMIPWLVRRSCEYLNFDLYNPAMRKMDITALDLPDAAKTLIWCSHVLEHIPDDMQALRELYRVLEPGGLLVLQMPISGEVTYEDPAVTSEQDRLEKFLQEDHVRLYGRDVRARIEVAGFTCEMLTTADFSPAERKLYGIDHPVFREVFVARRPEASA